MRKKFLTIAFIVTGIVLLIATSILFYKEWSPEDDSAATVY